MSPLAQDKLGASQFRRMMFRAVAFLEAEKENINALNVFPVPDGDTGSNMCLTMQAAVDQLAKNGAQDLAAAAHDLSYGSLMGARGNSGVILSQILRGISLGLEGRECAGARELSEALHQGVKTAYKAVMKPVEGTILTVAREASVAARRTALENGSLDQTLDSALEAARLALDRTPEQLAVLKRAGVVDAGGKGLVCILEGMLAGWRGQEEVPLSRRSEVKTLVAFQLTEDLADITFPYDVELMIRGESVDSDNLNQGLEALGDSIVVVGAGDVTKVHVHTGSPAEVLSLCLSLGEIDDVVIRNMVQQHRQLERASSDYAGAWQGDHGEDSSPRQVGLVVVAAGEGFARLYRELGADQVVPGGQTMNPSTQEILEAVEKIEPATVFVLPNNPNVVMTCKQVDNLTEKSVIVIETRDMAQGVAALMPWQPDKSPEDLRSDMEKAFGVVKTGSVTYAVRGAEIDGIAISEGAVLGLANDKIVVAGDDAEDVLAQLIGQMVDEDSEFVSIYGGQMVTGEILNEMVEKLSLTFPDVEIEALDGGQDHYYYLVSVE